MSGASLSYRFRLLRLDYEFRDVRVLFLRDVDGLPLPGGRVNVRKGDEIDVPRWQARLLESMGLVEVRDKGVDIDYINMQHFKEKKTPAANQIQALPQDFYQLVRDYIAKLNEAIRREPGSMLIRDREAAEKNTIDLAEARLSKIVRLALTGASEYKDRLTPEERLIFDYIQRLIEDWRSYVHSVARGERA